MAELRARRAPLVVHLMGRWYQFLGVIVLMLGVASVQFSIVLVRAAVASVALVGLAFLALSVLLFVVGHFVILGRRWAWRLGVIVGGALLVVMVYKVAGGEQPLGQRIAVTAVTAILFGVPLVGLGLPASRQFFARRDR